MWSTNYNNGKRNYSGSSVPIGKEVGSKESSNMHLLKLYMRFGDIGTKYALEK